MITSRDNQYIKLLRELQQKKYRQRHGLFIAEGKRLVTDIADAGIAPHIVLYAESFEDVAVVEQLAAVADRLLLTTDDVFRTVADTEHSQGILAAYPLPCANLEDFLRAEPRLFFVVSAVRDPGNLGAILRNAAAAGVDGVLLERGSVDLFNAKVVRATMGALVKVPVFYDLEAEEIFKNIQAHETAVYLADMEGDTPYWQLPLNSSCAVILGGEADGAAPFWREKKLPKTFIPQQNGIESLNVAMAAGIIAFDFLRRRLK